MEPTQLLLTIVVSVSTLLLIFVGIQCIFVLMEFKKTLYKVNKILTGFESLGTGLDNKVNELMSFFHGLKTVAKVADIVTHHSSEESSAMVEEESPQKMNTLEGIIDKMKHMAKEEKQVKKFFVKDGKIIKTNN
jgi:hypothetical protein